MKEFIKELAMKYGIPEDKMSSLVMEVVERVEKDLPVTCAEQIKTDLGSSLSEDVLKRIGLFPIP